MASYKVILQSQPEKYYQKTQAKIAKAIEKCFELLEDNPRQRLGKLKELKGYDNVYRYQVGHLRIIYEIHEDKKEVSVMSIWPRGDVYKKL